MFHSFRAVKVSWEPQTDGFKPPHYSTILNVRTYGKHARVEEFTLLPTTSLIGLPLEYVNVLDVGFYYEHDPTIVNNTVKTISTDFDPESSTFGQPQAQGRGMFIIDRVDGDDLSDEVLEAVEAFIKEQLLEWFKMKKAGKDDVESKKEVVAKLAPAEFKKFFEAYSGEKGWEGVVCSV